MVKKCYDEQLLLGECIMAIEQYTESLTLQEMKCTIGENQFGYVFPQGDVSSVDKLDKLLKIAGGKPKECELDDYDYPKRRQIQYL